MSVDRIKYGWRAIARVRIRGKIFEKREWAKTKEDAKILVEEMKKAMRKGTPVFDCSLVSIHTPVWGVTRIEVDEYATYPVSIHTPVWGVTFWFFGGLIVRACFNPHARMGRDCIYRNSIRIKEDNVLFREPENC